MDIRDKAAVMLDYAHHRLSGLETTTVWFHLAVWCCFPRAGKIRKNPMRFFNQILEEGCIFQA